MKKIIVLFIGIFISMMASAQDEIQVLMLQLGNGEQHAFALSEKPIITLPDDAVAINGLVETTYKRSEVAKFFFDNISKDDPRLTTGGIDATGKNNVVFTYLDGENVYIKGLKDKTTVSLISIGGGVISKCQSDTSGNVHIALGNLPKGVYIISYGDRSVKIKK